MLNTPSSLRGMVTSPHHLASEAGLDVLKDGGTAVEAVVAVAATLAVVYPHMTSIGGDGFWVIGEPNGQVHAIDACGGAAAKADLHLYRGHQTIPWRGPLAANTVAGTISGWAAALATGHNTLPLDRLLRDAIHYAKTGVVVTEGGAEIAANKGPDLAPVMGYADVFMPHGKPLAKGDILKQPALANTLRRLCVEGLQSFYAGDLARDIAADLEAAGTPLTADDLARHKAIRPAALTTRMRGANLFNTAPPTQGFASLAILALFDRLGIDSVDDFPFIHGLVEATKQAFLIRDQHIGDPAYMSFDPQDFLSDATALDILAGKISRTQALPWPHRAEGGDTVWFGAIDERGQAVSAIQSTYFEFGAGLVLPETGIVWQNRGASFRLQPDGWNALKPGRRPFHTLNPALALFDDGRKMVYGTMGGEGQPQTQAVVFSRYNAGIDLQAAITAPRWLLGKTWGEESTTLKIENRFDPAVINALRAAGHDVEVLPAFTSTMGHAGAIVRHPNGRLEGANDPRSDGRVAAY